MANRIQDAFDNIKADSQLVESTKKFLSEKRRGKGVQPRRPAFLAALAASIALFLMMGIGGYTWVQAPVSYVAIDINPSMELALNRFDKVVSVKAYNAEGEEIIKGLPLKGKLYTDAIDLIMACKAMEAYLTEKADLVFTVAADNSREIALKSGVESCASHSGHNSQSFSVDMEAAAQAHGFGLSLGKYYAWLQLIQYDDTVTVDECRDMSMAEIHGLISEHEHGGEHGEESHEEEHMQDERESHEEGHMQDEGESHEEEHMQDEGEDYEGESHEEEHMQDGAEDYEGESHEGESHEEEHTQSGVGSQNMEYSQELEEGQGLRHRQDTGHGAGHMSDIEYSQFGNGGTESGRSGHHKKGSHE